MPTRLFSDLVEDANADVPGCPFETIRKALRQAARDVCEETLLWRYEIRGHVLVPALHEYAYNVPEGAEVVAVFGVMMNGFPLSIETLEGALERYPMWADVLGGVDPFTAWAQTPPSEFNQDEYNANTFNVNPAFVPTPEMVEKSSQPRIFTQLNPHRFIVLPSPDDEQEYKLRIFTALRPALTSEGMDRFAADELGEAIKHRALQRLMAMPDKPWTNYDMAAYHAKQYRYTASSRRARAEITNGRGRVRVQMRGWT